MAYLKGRSILTGDCGFCLSPVLVPGQDSHTYVFTGYLPDGSEWYQTHSVAGWFTPYDDVWVLARAFAEVRSLIGAYIPVDLWDTGRQMKACIVERVDWLHIQLSIANQARNQVSVTLFVQDNTTSQFRHLHFLASIDDVETFGNELVQEVIAANPSEAAKGAEDELVALYFMS
ncbi:MAG: hypothetical protein EOP49_25725 [Sphingobacteriales bacterium]|nr:MAG: hypothetical protein EOP49_25725 [Sphingobacteriales bacterium]